MSKTEVGKTVPPFKLPATGNKMLELKSLRGKNVVVYFYPKDSTPGCTNEGCDFKAHHLKFKRCNTIVLGISRDTLTSHEKFKAKYNFPFDLLSDTDEKVCNLFEVISATHRIPLGGVYIRNPRDRACWITTSDGPSPVCAR